MAIIVSLAEKLVALWFWKSNSSALKARLCHLLALWCLEGHLTSLNLSFFNHKIKGFCKIANEIKSMLAHYTFLSNFLWCGWFQKQFSWSELLILAQNLNLHCNGKLNASQFIHYGKENQLSYQAKGGFENQFRLTHWNQKDLDKKG